jgi:hypothetical protein
MTALIAILALWGWLYVLELQHECDVAEHDAEKWRRRAIDAE